MAANAARGLAAQYGRISDSVRRLSSGLRVGISADDAAGLAIRELMRADIAAYRQGIRNANDAISLIQTADGALQVIDEKLIRMKELAEQAATGTYNSDQRLMIESEFQAMGAEIQRIATATDFNGVKLLDGSLSGTHDGSGLKSLGELKVHFGTGNDSAEDYYYLHIGDATLSGLNLAGAARWIDSGGGGGGVPGRDVGIPPFVWMDLNDYWDHYTISHNAPNLFPQPPPPPIMTLDAYLMGNQDTWYGTGMDYNISVLIPQGTRNIVISMLGASSTFPIPASDGPGDNDIQLFTTDGRHIAGTPLTDRAWGLFSYGFNDNSIAANYNRLGFTPAQYDGSQLNTGMGGTYYDPMTLPLGYYTNPMFRETVFDGMRIFYTGDSEQYDVTPNDGRVETWYDFETLAIDVAREDLILYLPGGAAAYLKAQWDYGDPNDLGPPAAPFDGGGGGGYWLLGAIAISTQDLAQRALPRIDEAIILKDNIRAHLGATQNRLENTVANLQIEAENLQAAESRISDVDVALEMTEFVRSQILTSTAASMLSHANSLPHMLMKLLQR
jgi:flagellin